MPSPRIAIAQIRPVKGDYGRNIAQVGSILAQIGDWDEAADVLLFPETMTSGYFLEGGVEDVAVSPDVLFAALAAQHAAAGGPPVDVVLGFYEERASTLYNAAMYATLGGVEAGIRHVHRKLFLPTYGVFDESRFVQAGHTVQAFDTRFGPAAVLICEDAWHSLVPAIAALRGARFLYVPSASPARGVVRAKVVGREDRDVLPASLERWELLVRSIAAEHGVFVALAQLVGFEGGKGFPGASMIAGPSGALIARGPLFEEAVVVADCDPRDITRARADAPLLADLEAKLPHLVRQLDGRGRRATAGPVPQAGSAGADRPASVPAPVASVVPIADPLESPDILAIDPDLVRRWLVAFIREEVVSRRGFHKGIVGLSGGVDSSLTAFLAVEALGRENVIGVRMPYETSSSESLEHAQLVGDALGLTLHTVDITAAVKGYASAVACPPDAQRLGNVMARLRMTTLFDLSAAAGALPLGTGNKTERLLGYFTWHADDSPPVNPLGDLFKTEVWALARHMGVPETIVSKPATADLIRGQTDEGDLGISYPKADRILYWLLHGYRPDEIAARGFTPDEIALVAGRLGATHWKRRLPTVAMVSQTAIGEYYLRPVDY